MTCFITRYQPDQLFVDIAVEPSSIFDADACTVDIRSRLLRRRRNPDVVSGADLLPLPATDLHCIDMYCHRQADDSTTMPNVLRGMYLLTTALRDM